MAPPPPRGNLNQSHLNSPSGANPYASYANYAYGAADGSSTVPPSQQSTFHQAYSGWQPYGSNHSRGYTDSAYSGRAPWPSESDGYMSRSGHDEQRSSPPRPNSVPLSSSHTDGDAKRLRTPPRPPPRSPSPSYLAQAEKSSAPLTDPTELRKLLILDLNGSLLIRASHKRSQGVHPYNTGAAPRPLRAVHPRPYMTTFKSFVFHPETRAWLDVMVWSSAQPHSVDDMVGHCFGEERDKLVAIWARDTLGLSEADYHRKTQTVKNLAKPWAELHLRTASPSSASHSPRSSSRERSSSTSPPPSPGIPSASPTSPVMQAHSARSTLLLDDSPLKARLQPWNHVCLKEYDTMTRVRDLIALTRSHTTSASPPPPGKTDASVETTAAEAVIPEGQTPFDAGKAKRKQRYRKKKQELQLAQAVTQPSAPSTEAAPDVVSSNLPPTFIQSAQGEDVVDKDRFDETLLAVIGILNAVKHEDNVAGWIRAGKLWGPDGLPTPIEPSLSADTSGAMTTPIEQVATFGDDTTNSTQYKRELSANAEESESKRLRHSSPLRSPSPIPGLMVDPLRDAAVARGDAIDPAALAGNDVESLTEPEFWFERPETMGYWISQGRRACEELGIEVAHGIER